MSVLKVVCHWSSTWQRQHDIPKGFILLRYLPKYRTNVGKALMLLDKKQTEQEGKVGFEDSLKELSVDIEIHYQKRSLSQNDLMWALYGIEANEMNGGRKGPDAITPQKIYHDDMLTFAPRIEVEVALSDVSLLRRSYSMVTVPDQKQGERVRAVVYVTSSHWNTKEMHGHLEMIFDRLSMAGVKESADIAHYWLEWRQKLNDEKMVLHTGVYTIAEYKELVKNCEACGAPVWHEDVGSSAAHIKAVGMGGHRVGKYSGAELMHLCDVCHAEFDNGKGRDKFLEHWTHLTYKVETCLSKTIVAEPQKEELEIW
jgi:hypothetical protein